jgi:hypothetical protein
MLLLQMLMILGIKTRERKPYYLSNALLSPNLGPNSDAQYCLTFAYFI